MDYLSDRSQMDIFPDQFSSEYVISISSCKALNKNMYLGIRHNCIHPNYINKFAIHKINSTYRECREYDRTLHMVYKSIREQIIYTDIYNDKYENNYDEINITIVIEILNNNQKIVFPNMKKSFWLPKLSTVKSQLSILKSYENVFKNFYNLFIKITVHTHFFDYINKRSIQK